MKRIAIALAAVMTSALAGETLEPTTGKAEEFFGATRLYTFHLTIEPADFRRMAPANVIGGGILDALTRLLGGNSGGTNAQPSRRRGPGFPFSMSDEFDEAPGKLEFEGKSWGAVSVRYKGNSTYWAANELKRSIKIDFNDKEKARTFFGMSKLNLNNNLFDSSQMREALAYDVFRRAGVPAPRTAFAKVFLTVPGVYDNAYAGLYTVIEQIDQTFFKDRMGAKTGVLVKPANVAGLPYLGEDWKSYESAYTSKMTPKPEDAARFITFVRFINQSTSDEEFSAEISKYLDVEEFLRFLAAQAVLVNMDGPLTINHNYWLTVDPKSHKVVWIPWDLNMSMGGFPSGDENLSVRRPSASGIFPLADRILAMPRFRQRYEDIVREIAETNFTVSRMTHEIDAIEAAIHDAIESERKSAEGNQRSTQAPPANRGLALPQLMFGGLSGNGGPPLRAFVIARAQSITAQLEGKREGTPNRGFGLGIQGAQRGQR